MIGVFAVKVFDPEVVNAEAKGDAASVVLPQTDSVRDGMIPIGREVGDKVIVRKHGCLF